MAPLRVALIGMGRMGQALDTLASSRGIDIVARLDATDMARGIDAPRLAGAEVAIEFTVPEAAVANAVALLALGCPVVIGTTGWTDAQGVLGDVITRTGIPALWSPNYSVGVQLFLSIVEDAARRAAHLSGFATHVVETHHSAKKDAPSGTGLAIADRLAAGLGYPVPVTSVRVGSVPGTHEILMDAPFEQIRLVHEARDRRVFADGALTAARWLAAGRAPQLYTMRDVVTSPTATP